MHVFTLTYTNLLQTGVCYFSSLFLGRLGHEPPLLFVGSCRCLWCAQLALVHVSPAWCALEYPTQPGVPRQTCHQDRGQAWWLGYLQHHGSACHCPLPPSCIPLEDPALGPCPGHCPDGLLGVFHCQLTGRSCAKGCGRAQPGLLKLRGRIYFVVWVGKWHGHPQLQSSCFALVEGK